jgi:hypothetical protein
MRREWDSKPLANDDAAIAEMKKNGTYLVPTLYLADWFLENAERIGTPAELIAKGRAVMPAARKNVARVCRGSQGRIWNRCGGVSARAERA